MIPVVITASIFDKNESAAFSQIEKALQNKSMTTCLLINQDFNHENDLSLLKEKIVSIKISDWLTETMQLRKSELRATADKLDQNKIILLNAKHHDVEVIENVLNEVSLIWFNLKSWQPAFILLVDDYHAVTSAQLLSETFYLRSLPTAKDNIQKDLAIMRMKIRHYRWLGKGRISRIANSAGNFRRKLGAYVQRKFFT